MVTPHVNALGQPIGAPVPGWGPRTRPGREPMVGRLVRVEPLELERHALDLWAAFTEDREHRMWTYFSYGPFPALADYADWIRRTAQGEDPYFHAIVDRATGRALGVAAFMTIDPAIGSIEVGHIAFSPALARTTHATEAMYLMMERAFALGYRRYEWKCDAHNEKSRAAALRLGLTFEGVRRHAWVYRGRNRDTAYFAAVDREWPALRAAFERWLDPANFAGGAQAERLSDLTSQALASA